MTHPTQAILTYVRHASTGLDPDFLQEAVVCTAYWAKGDLC